jgi:3-dehydroquinate synthase
MPTLQVDLRSRSYPIWVEPGLLDRLAPRLADLNHGQQWVIITQPTRTHTYARRLQEHLRRAGLTVALLTIPSGEQAKRLTQVEELYSRLVELRCDRSATLLALGGGVVGDVTGFVAATYMRGIPYLQIPTTLLAMVDSAIGGKTGVNLPYGKNLVGAIYQPRAVVIDPLLLRSLPERERISGLAEVLKYGAIRDAGFFREVSHNLEALLAVEDMDLVQQVITRSCAIKAEIVARDEQERDLRRILNFGHTIGHALETDTGYGVLRHGEAVAYGMLCAGKLSHTRGWLAGEEWSLLRDTIRRLPLPELPDLDRERLLQTVRRDKKVRAGVLHFVLLEKLGSAVVVDDVTEPDLLIALEAL